MNTKISTGENQVITSAQSVKPITDIENIIEKTAPFATRFNANKGEILRYYSGNKRTCYLLHQGSVTLNRRGDGMVLNSEKATFILGVSNQLSQAENLYIRVNENAVLSRLTLERFNLLIESFELWDSLCKLLIYTASRVYEHCTLMSHMSSYEIIRFQLLELMNESERIRNSITAANYIKSRTYLSRSGIMRILADLRDAGCIELNRGVLISIKHLPLKY
ncbi:TPA: helix-turn-helix domain-containing protein [Enterobacter asburiae]|uniref:helix-turn-helix domain-containing protein n=1 Tax=Enterobacter asburiae TaxID=61645 RepID=UPI000798F93A|nr:helix-turn-helix domain-containing protein [Enterobacter asburiae]SAH18802.1 cyclic nucleotide-binding domain-containing protein [Enterobacter cloacae]MDL4614296.1 helix-turn-helix domain-containing protein [Enterobacter asburiae]HCM9129856.1 helix-turn-helix domain-containing protein [Enterobacter asburiae]HDW1999885.1 helix-turn-helix domain-containing protein [Enterobacter asburiae]HED1594219.1 helix-turn-helix domain-containing protein [Enterobacter asburiae]